MASYVSGIDVGHMAIRAVVLKKTADGWQVHEHGSVERFYGSSGEKSFLQEFAELSTLVQLRGPVFVTDSTMSVMVRFIASVPLPEDRLRRLVRLDLEQHIDDSGDLAADMFVLPIAGDDIISCCPLAQPKQVNDLLYVLKKNKIKTQAVTIPSAAMFNATRAALKEQEGYSLVIDVGAASTRLIIMRGDEFIACRSLSIGGRQFTEALVERRDKSFVDAEKLKISGLASHVTSSMNKPFADDADTGVTEMPVFEDDADDEVDTAEVSKVTAAVKVDDLFADELDLSDDLDLGDETAETQAAATETSAAALETGTLNFTAFEDVQQIESTRHAAALEAADPMVVIDDGADFEVSRPGMHTMQIGQQQLGEDLIQVAEQLHMHIASSLKWFKSQIHMPNLEIDSYYLLGGSAKLNGLRLYLEHRLGSPVKALNPLSALDTSTIKDATVYTSAIGAALQVEEGALQFDVRPESIKRRDLWKREIIWPRLAAGFLLVAGILWSVSIYLNQLADQDAKRVYDKHEADRKTEMAQLQGLRSDRDAMFEDIRGIAGRIYAGRDLLNAIRAFKEKAPQDLWIITLATMGIIDEGKNTKERGAVDIQNDTAIDRGSVIVTGRVMPDKKADVAQLQQQFQRWYENINQWQEAENKKLFKDSKVIKLDVDHENDQAFVFEVRFDFQQTSLQDVATMMDEVSDAP